MENRLKELEKALEASACREQKAQEEIQSLTARLNHDVPVNAAFKYQPNFQGPLAPLPEPQGSGKRRRANSFEQKHAVAVNTKNDFVFVSCYTRYLPFRILKGEPQLHFPTNQVRQLGSQTSRQGIKVWHGQVCSHLRHNHCEHGTTTIIPLLIASASTNQLVS